MSENQTLHSAKSFRIPYLLLIFYDFTCQKLHLARSKKYWFSLGVIVFFCENHDRFMMAGANPEPRKSIEKQALFC